jgi:hypothetical protein
MGRIYQPKGARGWYVDTIAADGKRIRKRVAKDRRTAERILRDMERKADLARAGLASGATNDVDVWKLYQDYIAHLEANGRRPETLRRTDSRIRPLLEHIGAQRVPDIVLDAIDGFKAEARNRRNGKPLAPQSPQAPPA